MNKKAIVVGLATVLAASVALADAPDATDLAKAPCAGKPVMMKMQPAMKQDMTSNAAKVPCAGKMMPCAPKAPCAGKMPCSPKAAPCAGKMMPCAPKAPCAAK